MLNKIKNKIDLKLETESNFLKRLFWSQQLAMWSLFLTLIVYFFFSWLTPEFDFLNSEFWLKTDNIVDSISQYWFVFAWCILLIFLTLSSVVVGHFSGAKKIFGLNVITSIFAGIWEEIGFRGLYIFTAMVGIMFLNFFLKWIILIVIVVFALIGIFKFLSKETILFSIVIAILAFAFVYWWIGLDIANNPVYWFYENIVFPVFSFISFGFLDSILYNESFSFLFIAGVLSANARFRDGHKYQGWFGYFNSWVIGFILIHIMMYHGLLVAIIIHILYDMIIGFSSFMKRLIMRKNY